MIKSEEEIGSRNGFDYLKATLSGALNQETRARVDALVQEVASLKDIEKLLFCLLLPVDGCGGNHSLVGSVLGLTSEESDISGHGVELSAMGVGLFSPGGASALHLSNQVEQSQAYTWILSHLEEDPSTCLRKDEVYEDYRAYCDKHHMKTLNTADFGKVMKRAFPNVKPRRLGQRGQSRYCYGGMRKKVEVKPPYLPDLTDEALGLTAQSGLGHSTTSPASSSGASGDVSQRRLTSTSPLIRLLQTSESGADGSTWADETSIRSALGVRGPVVVDVAHILLEYAQQVLGMQFQSLFHLAQHLVSYRYVNSRSRYAFSLIAHAANAQPTSCSPPPTAVLAEALQKGISKSAFGRVGNGRQKSGSSDRGSFVKADDDVSRTPSRLTVGVSSPMPTTPTTVASSRPLDNHSGLSNDRSSVLAGTGNTRGFSTPLSSSSVSQPDLASNQLPECSTPQQIGAYRSFPSSFSTPQNQLVSLASSNTYAAAALVSPALQHNFAHSTQTYTQPVSTAIYQGYSQGTSSSLRHPLALAAAAAVAAHHQQQQLQQQSVFTPYAASSHIPTYTPPAASASPNLSHTTQLGVVTPPIAHKDKTNNFPTPSTPATSQSDLVYSHSSSYLSPAGNSLYAAHQQTSPYPGVQQPPAPLPPTAGARSPYTPIGNPALSGSDVGHMKYKRGLPHPVEAPGAYEPSPRFHLGGQSPNKRSRYLSTNSSTSTANSSESVLPGSAMNTDSLDPYGEQSQSASVVGGNSNVTAAASPASSGSSSSRSVHLHTPSMGMNTYGTSQTGSLSSPYCSSRYEGLEMRSPAPHMHGQTSTNSTVDRRSRLQPLTPGASDSNAWSNAPLAVNGTVGLPYGYDTSLSTVSEVSSSTDTVFRPPVTPFVLELEDENDLDNLPRLGSSPGPQIPPSSPTEFLPFYSEAATKSAKQQQQQKQQQQHLCSTKASNNTPETEDCSCNSSSSPHLSVNKEFSDSRRHRRHPDANLETPPPSALGISEHICQDALGSPNSPNGSDDSHDRTLTNFEPFDPANTDSIPVGLVVANSPSTNNELVRQREELQNQLSTPGPSDANQPIDTKPDISGTVSRTSSIDVSIPAF
ncbi:DNA-binding protein RFX7 [Fasciola gigantica]|uniref:DNA-binding protein RFX7 n=1 Tax=Fasciola gigantica TaxID=46835 RepID=A0A504Y9V4_FASGI|nr:DNA-binding protein RFX7 [Fasciola gigantica]